jgi:hypothetical protein
MEFCAAVSMDWRACAGVCALTHTHTHFVTHRARQQFQECLGDSYGACLDPLYYLRHNIGRDRAFMFLSIFWSMEWKCIGGFQGEQQRHVTPVFVYRGHP